MKIMHIFSAVVAIHLVVGLFAIALPGCRTGSKSKTTATAGPADPAAPGAPGAPAVRLTPTRPGGDTVQIKTTLTPVEYNYGELTPAPLPAPLPEPAPAGLTPAEPASPLTLAPVVGGGGATTSYEVKKGDSLWTIARKHGIRNTTELAAANNLPGNATLRIGQKLVIPAPPAATPAAAANAAPTGGTTHTVISGDTLGVIARKHGVKLAALRAANHLRGDNLRVGQVLAIPAATTTPQANDTTSHAPTTGGGGGTGAPLTYTVKTGDTLGAIAKEHGVKVGAIAAANNITDPRKLRVGQELKIPGATATAPAASATTVTPAPTPNHTGFNPEPVEYAPATPAPVPLTPTANSPFTPSGQPGTLAPDDALFNPGTASPPPARLTPAPIVPAEGN
jgi:LysM repeat protein